MRENYGFLGGTEIGCIETGEAIFYSETDNSFSIEKEHRYLVEPTVKEMEIIYKQFPKLKPVNEAGS
jgi:hypothetical protein